jgi:hypothetical protein
MAEEVPWLDDSDEETGSEEVPSDEEPTLEAPADDVPLGSDESETCDVSEE